MGLSIWPLALAALAGAAPPAATDTTAFVHANVVPMDTDAVREDYTVVVAGDRIVAVGPAAEIAVPAGATLIDATGQWLIPGLADMHMHLFADPSPDFMRLWLAEGVTTVRNLNTRPEHRAWAEEVRAGTRAGPAIYNTGPAIIGVSPGAGPIVLAFKAALVVGLLLLVLVTVVVWRVARGRWPGWRSTLGGGTVAAAGGILLLVTHLVPLDTLTSPFFPEDDVVETASDAARAIRRQAGAGYRLAKIYEFMGVPAWLAAQAAAEQAGVYSISHLESGVGLAAAVASGMDEVAHVDEFLDYILAEPMDPERFRPIPADSNRLAAVIDTVAGHGLMVISNLVVDENIWRYLEAGPAYFDRPEYAVVRPETLAAWRTGRVVNWQGQQAYRRSMQPYFAQLVKGLHDAGVPILTGTDVGVEGITPAHLHREIELLVEAGLSRYEALRAATANAGESLRRAGFEDAAGTVTPGARADLVLLRGNPLTTPNATRDRAGVMARGRWYSRADLDRLTAELVASY